MSAQSGSSSVWVWCPASGDPLSPFQHPSDIPTDENTAKTRWVDNVRGPRLARISAATLLQTKGSSALIAENGATREVPRSMVLPWYEGLLLLEELEASQGQRDVLKAIWCDDDLRGLLDTERGKFRNGQLSGALYTERRLVTTAVTGSRFIDADNREFAYRRENIKSDDKASIAEGQDSGSFFRIREIIGYLPPWEAFCHEKCGFYQDFYQVRWEHPFSEVDYSRVENGCTTTGATWEPDECLPCHLDSWRVTAKRNWVKKRRDQEQKQAEEKMRVQSRGANKRGAEPSPTDGLKRQRSENDVAIKKEEMKEEDKEEKKVPVKMARLRRDGKPLEADVFRFPLGHDFATPTTQEFAGIRSGWPKNEGEYPPGYGVASPPGFCKEGCDCMDDQRPQRAWETTKAWLEDPTRDASAKAAIETFSQQTHFVRRRGQVSKMFYFETASGKTWDQSHARSAADLAGSVQRRILEVLRSVPLESLQSSKQAVRLPAAAFLNKDDDYEPLAFEGSLSDGEPLPSWATLGRASGSLIAQADQTLASELQLQIELRHVEGAIGSATCTLTPQRHSGPTSPWALASEHLVQRFNDYSTCQLDRTARATLQEHLSEVYDFNAKMPRAVTLGAWLAVMARFLRMLRSASMANVTLAAVHMQLRGVANVPRTPPQAKTFNPATVQPQTPPQ